MATYATLVSTRMSSFTISSSHETSKSVLYIILDSLQIVTVLTLLCCVATTTTTYLRGSIIYTLPLKSIATSK